MPKVKVNDIEMYYEVHGEGTPLLMIMGYGSSSEDWEPEVINKLSKKHQVITYDNRGTGRSSIPDIEYTIQDMAQDSLLLLESLNISKAHIAGFSMGGMIAQEISYRNPDSVKSLILGCTSSDFSEVSQEFYEYVKVISEGKTPEKDPAWVLGMCYTPKYIKENMAEIASRAASVKYPTSPVGFYRQAQAIINYEGVDWVSKYSGPCLVLAGEHDPIVLLDTVKAFSDGIPGSVFKVLMDTSHIFMREAPEETVSTILGFLEEVDS
jgi:pimeloyl-ACP methyl ester carboxylesterase